MTVALPSAIPFYEEVVRVLPQLDGTRCIHIAIMREPWLSYVLDGSKTIESRFAQDRRAPWQAAQPGDVVLWKGSGGPVVAQSVVEAAEYHLLDSDAKWAGLLAYIGAIRITPEHLDAKRAAGARYASLLRIGRPTECRAFELVKRDQRGWVAMNRPAGLFATNANPTEAP